MLENGLARRQPVWVHETVYGLPEGYRIEAQVVGGKKVAFRVVGPPGTLGPWPTLDKARTEAERDYENRNPDDPDGPSKTFSPRT